MNIASVKTAFKIADVVIDHSDVLAFNYLTSLVDENGNSLPQSILTKNVGRVYIIAVDGVIKKLVALKLRAE